MERERMGILMYPDALERAAQIIEADGWHKHMYHGQILDAAASSTWTPGSSQTWPHCVVGSLVRALAEHRNQAADEAEITRVYADHSTRRLIEINMYHIHNAAEAAAFLHTRASALRA